MLGGRSSQEVYVFTLLVLMGRLLDAAIPPAGGPQSAIDARFAEIVDDFRLTA